MSDKIKVVIAGAAGRMGQESVRAILDEADSLELVGAIGSSSSEYLGQDIAEVAGRKAIGIKLENNLKDCLQRTSPDVMLDLTVPSAVYNNACTALECGVRPILGATGLSDTDLIELEKKANYYSSAVLIAPNFAIGALLMIELAKKAAKYMPQVEIIEYHHDKKVDAPSGTATKTAKELSRIITEKQKELTDNEAPRGEMVGNIRVHSLRLPGTLANQEVIFGSKGQTLTIKHDTLDRGAFMPGVILAIKEITKQKGLIYGLEKLL